MNVRSSLPPPSSHHLVPNFFAPGNGEILALLFARVAGLVMIAPMFTSKAVPVAVKTAIPVLLTLLLHPLAAAATQGVIPQITPETVIGETLIGFALGLGAALLVGASSLAGELMGVQVGLSGAAVLDPINNSQGNVLGT